MNITDAKIKLMQITPFFGTILYHLETVEDNEIPTIGTDGEKLFYNKKFWNSLDDREQLGVLMHETVHLCLNHIWRGRNLKEIVMIGGMPVPLWNLAADVVVNRIINWEMGDPSVRLPGNEGINYYSSSQVYNGMDGSAEEVYLSLLKYSQSKSQQSKGFLEALKNAVFEDDKSKWNKEKDKKKQRQQEEKMKSFVKEAAENQKKRGYTPRFLERIIDEVKPKENWRTILREFIQPFNNDYSFNPVDRRYAEEDFMLPDVNEGEKIDWIAVAVDTSGSIHSKMINSFISEVKEMIKSVDQVKAKITFCDAHATEFEDIFDDKSKWNIRGGGGTSFKPPFKLIEKEDSAPKVLVYFTDLYGDFPDKKPDFPVL